MSLEEFDVEKYINYEKAGSREDGIAEGIAIGEAKGEATILNIVSAISEEVRNGIVNCADIAARFGKSVAEIESIRNMMIL